MFATTDLTRSAAYRHSGRSRSPSLIGDSLARASASFSSAAWAPGRDDLTPRPAPRAHRLLRALFWTRPLLHLTAAPRLPPRIRASRIARTPRRAFAPARQLPLFSTRLCRRSQDGFWFAVAAAMAAPAPCLPPAAGLRRGLPHRAGAQVVRRRNRGSASELLGRMSGRARSRRPPASAAAPHPCQSSWPPVRDGRSAGRTAAPIPGSAVV